MFKIVFLLSIFYTSFGLKVLHSNIGDPCGLDIKNNVLHLCRTGLKCDDNDICVKWSYIATKPGDMCGENLHLDVVSVSCLSPMKCIGNKCIKYDEMIGNKCNRYIECDEGLCVDGKCVNKRKANIKGLFEPLIPDWLF